MSFPSQFELDSKVLSFAIRQDVVDAYLPRLDVDWNGKKFMEWASDRRSIDPINPSQFNLLSHPKSRRYQESAFDGEAQATPLTEYWACELSRIYVPDGEVGFLIGIEQVVNDADGNYFPSSVTYWGSPRFEIPDVDNLRWYLKLDYYDGLKPARYIQNLATPITPDLLPGYSYSELPEIDALWYPAHNGSRKMRLIIPGQTMLRFFIISPPTTVYQWRARGKLRAYTQSTYCAEAAGNARMLF